MYNQHVVPILVSDDFVVDSVADSEDSGQETAGIRNSDVRNSVDRTAVAGTACMADA